MGAITFDYSLIEDDLYNICFSMINFELHQLFSFFIIFPTSYKFVTEWSCPTRVDTLFYKLQPP